MQLNGGHFKVVMIEKTKDSNSKNHKFLNEFAAHVFKELKLDGWRVSVWDGTFCANDLKFIAFGDTTLECEPWYYIKEMFLHEVAHIGETRQGSVVTHDADFFRRLGKLHNRFADFEPEK